MQPVILPEPETLSREQLEAEVRTLRAQSASLALMFEQAPSFIALLTGPEHRFALTAIRRVRLALLDRSAPQLRTSDSTSEPSSPLRPARGTVERR